MKTTSIVFAIAVAMTQCSSPVAAIDACDFSSTGKICQYVQKEVDCIAKAVYHEARGESTAGQKAVALVITNRTKHKKFGNNICDTVYQKAAFSGLKKSMVPHEKAAWDKALRIASDVYVGKVDDLTFGSTFYHTPAVNPKWNQYMDVSITIGSHIFYVWDGDWKK